MARKGSGVTKPAVNFSVSGVSSVDVRASTAVEDAYTGPCSALNTLKLASLIRTFWGCSETHCLYAGIRQHILFFIKLPYLFNLFLDIYVFYWKHKIKFYVYPCLMKTLHTGQFMCVGHFTDSMRTNTALCTAFMQLFTMSWKVCPCGDYSSGLRKRNFWYFQ